MNLGFFHDPSRKNTQENFSVSPSPGHVMSPC